MNMKQVQLNLIMLGYGNLLRPYGADGVNGKLSKNAIRNMQKDYNNRFKKMIAVDGIAGIETKKAITTWLRNVGLYGTKNFKVSEFNCSGKMLKGGMDVKLLQDLERLRYNLGDKDIVVNSGYRCSAHNKAVGGIANSEHLYGRAADIRVIGVLPSKVYLEADKIFKGVGKYRTFTHVDNGAKRIRFDKT